MLRFATGSGAGGGLRPRSVAAHLLTPVYRCGIAKLPTHLVTGVTSVGSQMIMVTATTAVRRCSVTMVIWDPRGSVGREPSAPQRSCRPNTLKYNTALLGHIRVLTVTSRYGGQPWLSGLACWTAGHGILAGSSCSPCLLSWPHWLSCQGRC